MSKSNRKLSRALDGGSVDHKQYMDVYRSNVMRVLNSIREGKVEEVDIDKLQNFCQMALALMGVVDVRTIQKAWRNAEAMSFLHYEANTQIIPDPKLYETNSPTALQGDSDSQQAC